MKDPLNTPMLSYLYPDWQDAPAQPEYETWEDLIEDARIQGYGLVPPEYHIPHVFIPDSLKNQLPKLYLMRHSGKIDRFKGGFDRPVSDLGYPVFFKED